MKTTQGLLFTALTIMALPASAQQATPQPTQGSTAVLQQLQQQFQQMQGQRPETNSNPSRQTLIPACDQDRRIVAQNQVMADRTSYLSLAPSRAAQLMARVAVAVRNRYSDIVHPLFSLGRLVSP